MTKALFEGLVFDEHNNALPVSYVGNDPTYVIVEDGFKYHVDAQTVDDQVLNAMREQIDQNPDLVGEGMMKMMGKDDLFTKAAVSAAIKNLDKNFVQLKQTGIPTASRQYLGMMGFRVVINRHGDVIDFNMPGIAVDDDEI
jgi:hypothetical protein